MPGVLRRSVPISEASLYDLRVHRDEGVPPLLGHWPVVAAPFAVAARVGGWAWGRSRCGLECRAG